MQPKYISNSKEISIIHICLAKHYAARYSRNSEAISN
jgi:hypothetical protein